MAIKDHLLKLDIDVLESLQLVPSEHRKLEKLLKHLVDLDSFSKRL